MAETSTSTRSAGAGTAALGQIDHIVVLMLENRSFDHMLGFLYTDQGNRSPAGAAFEGLTGRETNPGPDGTPVPVFRITPDTPNAYLMPGADPGEGYLATNSQLFGSETVPHAATPTNQGFVTDFAQTLGWEVSAPGWTPVAGTTASDIMGMHTPQTLPILCGLAKGYAVSDQWYSSVPTETMPNRAFALAATSQGHMDDQTKLFTCPSIFTRLSAGGVTWRIYGYTSPPLTRQTFTDVTGAAAGHFGLFADFESDASKGTLPGFAFLEPSWGNDGNSQHPVSDVAAGETLIRDVYYALRNGPGWNGTLLMVTYDEHGGGYDHVAPPGGAAPPDATAGQFGFDFTRFGVRVPTVLVSPWVPAGTVFRVPPGGAPLDHTSILSTLEARWSLPPLTARDAAAPTVAGVLGLSSPRPPDDDPLAGVQPPQGSPSPAREIPSHLLKAHASLVAQLPVPGDRRAVGELLDPLTTTEAYTGFIDDRTMQWQADPGGGGAL